MGVITASLESREIFCTEDYLSLKICGIIVERNVACAELVITTVFAQKKYLIGCV